MTVNQPHKVVDPKSSGSSRHKPIRNTHNPLLAHDLKSEALVEPNLGLGICLEISGDPRVIQPLTVGGEDL